MSSSANEVAKFSSNNLRSSEARKEASFTIVRTPHSLQRNRGSKARLELLEVLTKVTLSGNHYTSDGINQVV